MYWQMVLMLYGMMKSSYCFSFYRMLMEEAKSTLYDKVATSSNTNQWEIVYVTMNDIYNVLMIMGKEGISKEHKLEHFIWNKKYLNNNTVDGDFEFDSKIFWTWYNSLRELFFFE